MKELYILFYFFTFSLIVSCQTQPPPKAESKQSQETAKKPIREFPPLPNSKKIADGVLLYEVELKRENLVNKVWIYVPEKTREGKLPCILIAPAGSRLIDGASLGESSRAEHLPYTKAGFIVVAYDIDGEPKNESDEATIEAMRKFKDSDAGLINQKNALDYALEKVSLINPNKIYTAGHSSAATHALLVAANEPRVKGVIAYAPATDIVEFLGENLEVLDDYVDGFKEFATEHSPINNTEKIKSPVFLFHSKDDSTVSIKTTEIFAEKLKKTNPDVTLNKAEKGEHYFSMINEGIPKAIQWLQEKSK